MVCNSLQFKGKGASHPGQNHGAVTGQASEATFQSFFLGPWANGEWLATRGPAQ